MIYRASSAIYQLVDLGQITLYYGASTQDEACEVGFDK